MRLRLRKVGVLLCAAIVGTWIYLASLPPLPQLCDFSSDSPIMVPRLKLRDGRYMAYKELGVPRENATHKIIFVHGFGNSRHDVVIADRLPQAFFQELGVSIISYDRPGYGDSDPDPNRTLKSMCMDIQELADQLQLGQQFYLSGFSLGGQIVWGALKYIPHRLAGAVLLAPAMNYWWNGIPAKLLKESFENQLPEDQWAQRVSHYFPWLTYWWNTQKYFPSSSVAAYSTQIQPQKQGVYVTLHMDMMMGWGVWDFSPLELANPFPNKEKAVHVWQGDNDHLVPVTLQRYIAQQLPWVKYHEVPGGGHMFPLSDGIPEAVLRSLLPHT
ncbi:uncharacterized protein LOC141647928 [Silene latifolia]|uniref:uncharacterized protein LOC141647928 n=1 Tax=Silene latifolia TaxID=37657 RepID=UPI003D76D2C1